MLLPVIHSIQGNHLHLQPAKFVYEVFVFRGIGA